VQVSKPMAIFGFHFCVTIFVGLCIYGIVLYLSEGLLRSDSLLSMVSYAIFILASMAGICFFGKEADQRRAEEIRTAIQKPLPSPKKKKN